MDQRIRAWVIVFGCGYIAVTSLLGLVVIVVRTIRTAGWLPVACKLSRLAKARPGSMAFIGGGFPVGKNAVVIQTTYTYVIRGSEYEGHRVGLFDADAFFGFPPSSNYDRKLYESLEQALNSGQEVQGWVSPSDPHKAMLTRQFYLRKLFFIVFLLVIGLAGFLYFGNVLLQK